MTFLPPGAREGDHICLMYYSTAFRSLTFYDEIQMGTVKSSVLVIFISTSTGRILRAALPGSNCNWLRFDEFGILAA